MYSYRPRPRRTVKPKSALSSKKYGNYHQPTNQRSNRPLKFYFFAFSLLAASGALAYWLFISASFRITRVEVADAKNFSPDNIANLVWQQAHSRSFPPSDNLFLFNEKKLLSAVNEQFSVTDLKISAKWPHTLVIGWQEKNYNLIWQEDNRFNYIDWQGNIILEKDLPDAGLAFPNLTIVFNRGAARKQGRQIKIDAKYLNFADRLNQTMATSTGGLPAKEIFIDNELNTVKVQIVNGPILLFNTEEAIDKQLIKLETLRKNELRDGSAFNATRYIDLRYGDRVFYQ